ncbi:hypothetical protein SUGI_1057670 [Cryptomeria japonica]|nr:hypothetical protein SUGI_1057670 [Cryptomeria japonica]
MAWSDSVDKSLSFFNAPTALPGEQEESKWNYTYNHDYLIGKQCYYNPAFDTSQGNEEGLLSSSLAYPPAPLSLTLNNISGMMNIAGNFDVQGCFSSGFGSVEASSWINGDEQRQKIFGDVGELVTMNGGKSADGRNEKQHCVFNDVGFERRTNSSDMGKVGVGNSKGKKNHNCFSAKNLMAERRRRKKLNDRLSMLRQWCPRSPRWK